MVRPAFAAAGDCVSLKVKTLESPLEGVPVPASNGMISAGCLVP